MSARWDFQLTPEQRATVNAIRDRYDPRLGHDSGRLDWWLFLHGSTIKPPKYTELRHKFARGGMARWRIEIDGTVSEWNELGRYKEMRRVDEQSPIA